MIDMMKLGMITAAMVLVTGCSAQGEGNASDDEAPAVDTEGVSAKNYTISLNCAKTLPGLPQPPCKPDLVFSQTAVQIWEPNNPYNLAPGYYIHFTFKNDSAKPTGPFTIQVKDQAGVVKNTVQHAGLAAGASASVIEVAPYQCGWARTAVLDTGNTVDEFSEANNATTYSRYCTR